MKNFLRKKAKKKKAPTQVHDIFVDKRKRVVSLKRKTFKFEVGSSDAYAFLKRNNRLIQAGVLCLVLIFIFAQTRQETRAEMAVFYPGNCLGGWQNPHNAQGIPQVLGNKNKDQFLSSNSAVLHDSMSHIYCGDFQGAIPQNTLPLKVSLKLSLAVKEIESLPVPQPIEVIESNTPSVPAEETAETPQEQNESEPQSETKPVESSPEPQPQTPEPDNSAGPPEGVDSPEENSAPANSDSEENSAAPEQAAPVSFLEYFIPYAHAQETETATSTAHSSEAAVAEAFFGNSSYSKNNILEVLYTLDGKTWHSLGQVSRENLTDITLDVSSFANLNWQDISNMQISIQSLPSTDEYTVYLDGMWIEAKYHKTVDMTDEETETFIRELSNKNLNITLLQSEGMSLQVATADDTKENLLIQTKEAGAVNIYNLYDPAFLLTSAIGDAALEIPAYFFSPGQYIIIHTKTDGCLGLIREECEVRGYEGRGEFTVVEIMPEQLVTPVVEVTASSTIEAVRPEENSTQPTETIATTTDTGQGISPSEQTE